MTLVVHFSRLMIFQTASLKPKGYPGSLTLLRLRTLPLALPLALLPLTVSLPLQKGNLCIECIALLVDGRCYELAV